MIIEKNKVQTYLDCEGPLTKNDNAFELTEALAVNISGLGAEVGGKFFERMSVVDDIWGDFGKVRHIDPSYSSGHTLKVILPFFRAMGATRGMLERLSADMLMVVPCVYEALKILQEKHQPYVISTSYDFYLRAFCRATGFPFERVRCTDVSAFDEIPMMNKTKIDLLNFMETVATMPIIQYDKKTGDVWPEHIHYYDRITIFIWDRLYHLRAGQFLKNVKPIGQQQKAEAVMAINEKHNYSGKKVMYVGDSQTDVQAVELVKSWGGLTMMFNGKGPVCALSDLMYIGEDARIISSLAEMYSKSTKEDVLKLCSPQRQHKNEIIAAVTLSNVAMLEEMSVAKRKEFRGVHIGGLT